jgi:[protein-PII] uridylyltransferase
VAELVTVDRPGLLARVGRAFVESGVKLQHAKIATFGERAEDVFFITDRNNRPLDVEALVALRSRLLETLNEP